MSVAKEYIESYYNNVLDYELDDAISIDSNKFIRQNLDNKLVKMYKRNKSLCFDYPDTTVANKVGLHRVYLSYKEDSEFEDYKKYIDSENLEEAEMYLMDCFDGFVVATIEDETSLPSIYESIKSVLLCVVEGRTEGAEMEVKLPDDFYDNPFKYDFHYTINDFVRIAVSGEDFQNICLPYICEFKERGKME